MTYLQCPYCTRSCVDLRNHITRAHPEHINDTANSPLRPGEYQCERCWLWKPSKSALKKHMREVHDEDLGIRLSAAATHKPPDQYGDGSELCPHCKASFGAPGRLAKHIKGQPPEQVEGYVCDVLCPHCRASFKPADLERHIKRQHPEDYMPERLACDVCGELYGGRGSLTRHKNLMHGQELGTRAAGGSIPQPGSESHSLLVDEQQRRAAAPANVFEESSSRAAQRQSSTDHQPEQQIQPLSAEEYFAQQIDDLLVDDDDLYSRGSP